MERRYPKNTLGRLSLEDPEFAQFAQFGLIDNALLIVPTLAGAELDDWLAERLGAKGYGAILGAAIGNAVSDGLAGLAESKEAAVGSFLGAMLPVGVLAVPLALKLPLKGPVKYVVGGISLGLVLYSIASRRKRNPTN